MIMLSVPGGLGELEELAEWLKQYPGLVGKVATPPLEAKPGPMGPAIDTLAIAVGSGGAITVLARGLVAWAASYRSQRGTDVHVQASRPGGVKITIDLKNTADAEAVLKQVLEQISADGS